MFTLQYLCFLSYFSASAQLNVAFLKEERLWIRVDADSLGSGVWHFPSPSADICHVTVRVEETRWGPLPPSYAVLLQICYHFPKFSFYLNVAFYSLNQIFWWNKGVCCGKLVHSCHYDSWDLCCILQNKKCRNSQCHFSVKMVGPLVANVESV